MEHQKILIYRMKKMILNSREENVLLSMINHTQTLM